ncbi:MAG TPA: chorismate-binding protein [Candidatus Baltobacteraceae bacterium]|nr:chorismate-binding protein [Candidatus Baltobacteraceae bacterium]
MTLRVIAGWEPALIFENPLQLWAPRTLDGALSALTDADQALDAGYFIAGALSYELGAMLHGVNTHASRLPLLLLGAFHAPGKRNLARDGRRFAMTAPLCRVDRREYETNVHRLLSRIRDGEVYQVNYTVPFDAGFSGDPFDLYRFLARRARARYAAFLEHEDVSLVSLSPELFLRFDGTRLSTKPMKGTAPLSRIEDLANEKNRAEHVMIVDLLRNDLHRVCTDVCVPRLFEIERYPTFATMTSTVTGKLATNSFAQVVRAVFPCGSVTGAPKLAAMRHIAQVETQPRGFYTGSMGFLSPGRRGWWNVPIRTLQFERGAAAARFDAGGGIVSDSGAPDEWAEIFLKTRVLSPAHDGFTIWETLRGGPDPSDAGAHVERLAASAAKFGWTIERDLLLSRLRAFDGAGAPQLVRVRAGEKQTRIHAGPLTQTSEPVRVCFASRPVRSDDPLLAHKTAWRLLHDAAAREARELGCFDALLRNERGEMTEGARTTLFVRSGGTLYTPPLSSGVLPGILRSRLVSQARAVERVLFPGDLVRADALYVGNSARGLLQAELVQDA